MGLPATVSLYSDADCTGDLIAEATSDGAVAAYLCAPSAGTYYLTISSTGYKTRCYPITVTEEDCAGTLDLTVMLYPDPYDVVIDLTTGQCFLPGFAVEYDDGTSTLNDVTDADGRIVFPDLPAPEYGANWKITVTPPADCGWDASYDFSGYVDDENLCPLHKVLTIPPADGFAYYNLCTRPFPQSFDLTIGGDTITLTNPIVGSSFSQLYWDNCTTKSCTSAAVPVECGAGTLLEGQQGWNPGTATVPVVYQFGIASTGEADPEDLCPGEFAWVLGRHFPITGYLCDIEGEDRPIGSVHLYRVIGDPGVTVWSTTTMSCSSPWVVDGIASTPSSIVVDGVTWQVFSGWQWTSESVEGTKSCDCPLSWSGSLGSRDCLGLIFTITE